MAKRTKTAFISFALLLLQGMSAHCSARAAGAVVPPPPELAKDSFLECAVMHNAEQPVRLTITNESKVAISTGTMLVIAVSEPLAEGVPPTALAAITIETRLEPGGSLVVENGFGAEYRSCDASFA